MAVRYWATGEDLTESSTSSTSPQTKLTLSADLVAGRRYLVLAQAQASKSNGGGINCVMQLWDGSASAELAQIRTPAIQDRALNYPACHLGSVIAAAATGPVDFVLRYWAVGATAYIKAARLLVLELLDDDVAIVPSDYSTSSSSYQDAATLTFTTTSSGDYLFLAAGAFDDAQTNIRFLSPAGTSVAELARPAQRVSAKGPVSWGALWRETLGAGSQTATIQFRATGGGSWTMSDMFIVALRLDTFAVAQSTQDGSADGGTGSGYTTSETLSASGLDPTTDALALASFVLRGSASSAGFYARGTVDSTDIWEHLHEPANATTSSDCAGLVAWRYTGGNDDPVFTLDRRAGSAGNTTTVLSAALAVLQIATAIEGVAAIDDAGETVAASGALAIEGAGAVSDAGEAVAASGVLAIEGAVAVDDAGETLAATGDLPLAAAAAVDDAGEVLAASGALAIEGAGAVSDAGETLAATGSSVERVAAVAVDDAGETVAASGALAIAGAVAVADAGETVAASGDLPIAAEVAIADAGETLAAAGLYRDRTAVAAIEDAGETVAAAGDLAIEGTAAVDDAGETVAATGGLAIAASAEVDDAGETLAAAGSLAIGGAAAVDDAGETVAAAGDLAIAGAAAIDDAGEALAAIAAYGAIAAVATIADAGESVAAAAGTTLAGAGTIEDAGERLGDGPPSPVRYYLLELDYYDDATGEVRTYYATDGLGLATRAGDDPADAFYEPTLQLPDDVLYGRSVFGDGLTAGASQIEISDSIALLNADGALDWMRGQGWDARSARLYRIQAGQGRSRAVLILSLVTEQLLPRLRLAAGAAESTMALRLKDPMAQFDRPFEPDKYLGTNVGPAGLEGTADDLKGLVKEGLYGRAYEVPGRMVNASLLVISLADHAIARVIDLYDSGVDLINEGDVETLGDLLAEVPASGAYVTCIAAGKAILGASPAGQITADVEGLAAPYRGGDVLALDGINQYLRRTGELFPAAPLSAEFTLSLWVRPDADNTRCILDLYAPDPLDGDVQLQIGTFTGGTIAVRWLQGGSARKSLSGSFSADVWLHLLVSWSNSRGYQLAIDGTVVSSAAADPFLMDITWRAMDEMAVGRTGVAFFNTFGGGLAELFLAIGQAEDLTVAANVEKFRTSGGLPADLGPDGRVPFGAPPQLYHRGGPDRFARNLGTAGGELAITNGPLDWADSSPYPPLTSGPGGTMTASALLRRVAQERVGWLPQAIDETAFAAAEVAAPEAVGVWVGSERSAREVVDEVAQSAGLAWWVRATGQLACARLDLPLGPPRMWLDWSNLIELEARPIYDLGYGTPVHSVVVERRRIYSVQDGNGLAGAVSDERRAYLAQEYRRGDAVQERSLLVKHPSSPELVIRTLITDDDDADAFAADRLDLYRRPLQRWRAVTWLEGRALHLDLMQTVGLRIDRYGHDDGLLYRIMSHRAAWRGGWVELDIWGGVEA